MCTLEKPISFAWDLNAIKFIQLHFKASFDRNKDTCHIGLLHETAYGTALHTSCQSCV